MAKTVATLLLQLVVIYGGFSQEIRSLTERVMFYNVENLFDIYNDSLKEDDDFLPGGLMRWNSARYYKKINALYKTIIAAGDWNTPTVVALCEVENRRVLENLIYGTYLSKFDYGIVHEESPDQRGIDVCLIYRKNCVRIIDYEYWFPSEVKRKDYTTRSVLYTKMALLNDTVHLIVNHWPSRRGGVLAGEDMRMKLSSMIREKADSIINRSTSGSKIIILGDFNSAPDDLAIKSLSAPAESGYNLVNLSERPANEGQGTYRYMGIWEMIDQVIVSEGLLKNKQGLFTDSMMLTIFRPDFLLKKDPKYPGSSPFSTYRGYKYQGGFSDHLPVLLDLKVR